MVETDCPTLRTDPTCRTWMRSVKSVYGTSPWDVHKLEGLLQLQSRRWQTVLPIGIPHLLTEDDVYDGHFIPAGTIVVANQWYTFRRVAGRLLSYKCLTGQCLGTLSNILNLKFSSQSVSYQRMENAPQWTRVTSHLVLDGGA